jgi:hypothetical protein
LKLLLLASDVSKQHISAVLSHLDESHELRIEWLNSTRQGQLSSVIDGLPITQFDRVLVWLPFKRIYSQIPALRKLSKLIVFDPILHELASIEGEELLQHVKLCKALPWARFVVCGQKRQRWLKKQGVDVLWWPPFMRLLLVDEGAAEKVNGVCFFGDPDLPEFKQHKEMLYDVRRELKIHIVAGDASLSEKLGVLDNSLMCFACDSPFGGVRRQTLEAFAAGCVVLLWPVDTNECSDLGLVDMENVALVDSKEALVAKVNFLQRHKDQSSRIASSGRLWLNTLELQAGKCLDAIVEPPFGEYTGDNAWSGLKYLFYR